VDVAGTQSAAFQIVELVEYEVVREKRWRALI
jgi:hypothetical protein